MVSSLLARCIIVLVGTLYPGYRSYKSLINSDLREVVNCLRYWIVFSIFIACETITDVLLSWFPFYYWIKIAIVLWIASPSGATFLYKRFIQPLLREREQDIDQLIEHTRQKGYSAILDLTNKGIRYASSVVLNSAVLGQTYLGEHLKRSLSTSDINQMPKKGSVNPPAIVEEESEQETDPEFSNRLKEDQKYLTKGTNRKALSQAQTKPDDSSDNPLDDYEMSKVMARKLRTGNKPQANENAHLGSVTKRSSKQAAVKKSRPKTTIAIDLSSNETDEEIDKIQRRPGITH